MGATLKYGEWDFGPQMHYSKGGECQSTGGTVKKAMGGACGGYKEGGTVKKASSTMCKAKGGATTTMCKAKGGKVAEKGTGEKYASKKEMMKHEKSESPREQRQEAAKGKIPVRKSVPVASQSPLIAMKNGGKCYAEGGKVKKMALGGSSSIRPGERQGSSPVAQARPPAPAAKPVPQKQPVVSARPVARPVARPAPQSQPIASQSQLRSAVQNTQPQGMQGGLQAGMKVPTQSPMQASMSGQAPSGNMQGGIQGNMQVGRPTSSDIPQGGQMGYRANNQATGMPQTPPQVNSPAMVQSRMYPGPMGVQGGTTPAPQYRKGGKVAPSKKK